MDKAVFSVFSPASSEISLTFKVQPLPRKFSLELIAFSIRSRSATAITSAKAKAVSAFPHKLLFSEIYSLATKIYFYAETWQKKAQSGSDFTFYFEKSGQLCGCF